MDYGIFANACFEEAKGKLEAFLSFKTGELQAGLIDRIDYLNAQRAVREFIEYIENNCT